MKSSKLDCRNMVGDDGQFCQNDLPNGPIERRIKTPIQFYGVFSKFYITCLGSKVKDKIFHLCR